MDVDTIKKVNTSATFFLLLASIFNVINLLILIMNRSSIFKKQNIRLKCAQVKPKRTESRLQPKKRVYPAQLLNELNYFTEESEKAKRRLRAKMLSGNSEEKDSVPKILLYSEMDWSTYPESSFVHRDPQFRSEETLKAGNEEVLYSEIVGTLQGPPPLPERDYTIHKKRSQRLKSNEAAKL